MKIQDAIEAAANQAYEENAYQIVGRIGRNDNDWQIAHNADEGRQSQMIDPKFLVHSTGVDQGHLDRGEITTDWLLP